MNQKNKEEIKEPLSTLSFAKQARYILAHFAAYYEPIPEGEEDDLGMAKLDYRIEPLLSRARRLLGQVHGNVELSQTIRVVLINKTLVSKGIKQSWAVDEIFGHKSIIGKIIKYILRKRRQRQTRRRLREIKKDG